METVTQPRKLVGWGRVAPSRAIVSGPLSLNQLSDLIIAEPDGGLLARGAGRSYGDAAQNGGGVVVHPVDQSWVEVDVAQAQLRASASVTFTELLHRTVSHGLLPPVLPGTRHLTVGGAVAADVHGKNHHGDGSIGRWVDEIQLLDGRGELRILVPGTSAFQATVGGMGLTGIIVAVRLRLLKIASAQLRVTTRRLPTLDALLSAQDDPGSQYAVAWVDMSAVGRSLGRGILDLGDHLAEPDPSREPDGLRYQPGHPPPAPALPACPVTPASARAFCRLWWASGRSARTANTSLAAYFHRLDAVSRWNRALGPAGFVQYQFAVPLGAEGVIARVIEEIQRHRAAPFLGTLKRFGPASEAYLSFPGPGWSLAVDMPAGRPGLRALLDDLDGRVAAAGGRVYLAKDARMGPAAFESMYGDLDKWRAARAELDPRGVFQSDLARRLGLEERP
jgi:decaprenylphospho-beta-D-ribofuranose 2-oxidase